MRSNLRMRSNVYLRNRGTPLCDDANFVSQVRGLSAVRILLQMFGVPSAFQQYDSDPVRSLLHQRKLTQVQHNVLKWEIRCQVCDSVPTGINFEGNLVSCCDTPGCIFNQTQAKEVLLSDSLLLQYRDDLRLRDALDWAINDCRGMPPQLAIPFEHRRRMVVRVDATTAWRYSEEELSAFIVHGLLKRS